MFSWLFAIYLMLTAGPQTTLNVSPRSCMAPCSIKAQVKVVPKEGDRWFELTADNENYFSMQGGPIPDKTTEYSFKLPYPGQYEFKLSVMDSTAHTTQTVISKVEVHGEN